MTKRFWLWTLGGVGFLWAAKAYAQSKKKLGELEVTLSFRKFSSNTTEERQLSNDVIHTAFNAVKTVKKVCPGFPEIQDPALSTGTMTTAEVGDTTVAKMTFPTYWTHDTMGPIREEVRKCLLGALQKSAPNLVNVAAVRIS